MNFHMGEGVLNIIEVHYELLIIVIFIFLSKQWHESHFLSTAKEIYLAERKSYFKKVQKNLEI